MCVCVCVSVRACVSVCGQMDGWCAFVGQCMYMYVGVCVHKHIRHYCNSFWQFVIFYLRTTHKWGGGGILQSLPTSVFKNKKKKEEREKVYNVV